MYIFTVLDTLQNISTEELIGPDRHKVKNNKSLKCMYKVYGSKKFNKFNAQKGLK